MVKIDNISYVTGGKQLVTNISYTFQAGKIHMICGPNGAGKTTLMRMLSLDLEPSRGTVTYNGKPTKKQNKEQHAIYRGVLSQQVDISFPLSVDEVIMMGRYPHFKVNPSKHDQLICDDVIQKLELSSFRKRNFLTLSGGEKQRVQFARVLAQIWEYPKDQNRILLLDEPISALDLRYQFEFLHHLEDIKDDRTVIIAILHDLNLVNNYADDVLLLNNSSLFASGPPSSVLNEENIRTVFHINTQMHNLGNINLLWFNKK